MFLVEETIFVRYTCMMHDKFSEILNWYMFEIISLTVYHCKKKKKKFDHVLQNASGLFYFVKLCV